VSQRDTNLYEHLQSEETRMTICDTIRAFYEDEVRGVYDGGNDCQSASLFIYSS